MTRRGWGEFPLRIQVHFRNPLCKPVNIIHNLKLDRSYTGIQTLGAETIVDVMVYGSNAVSSSSSPLDEISSHVNIKSERSGLESDNLAAVKTEVHEENEVLALKLSARADSFHNPQCMEENTSSDATAYLSPQQNHVSGQNNFTDTKYKDREKMDDCSLVELSGISEIGEHNNLKNTYSNEEQNQVCEPTIFIPDHDYFGRENEKPRVGNSILPKPSTNVEEFRGRGALECLNSTSLITSVSSLPLSSTTDPVLVRCFNKNGAVLKLPLALLRNAVILQPYRVAKIGDSLLRLPAPKATPESPANTIQPVPGKNTNFTAKPFSKPDTNWPEKISVEARFNNERKNCDAFFEKIYSTRWSDVRNCVRILARELCLVNSKAEDPVYRSVRPYTSPSLEIFGSWSILKTNIMQLFICLLNFILS